MHAAPRTVGITAMKHGILNPRTLFTQNVLKPHQSLSTTTVATF